MRHDREAGGGRDAGEGLRDGGHRFADREERQVLEVDEDEEVRRGTGAGLRGGGRPRERRRSAGGGAAFRRGAGARRRRIEELEGLGSSGDPDLEVVLREAGDGAVLPVEGEDVQLEDVDVDPGDDLAGAGGGRRRRRLGGDRKREEPREEARDGDAASGCQAFGFPGATAGLVAEALRAPSGIWSGPVFRSSRMMRSRKRVRTPSRPSALKTLRTSFGESVTPVIALRYWQKTIARDRNETTRMKRRRSANASGAKIDEAPDLEDGAQVRELHAGPRLLAVRSGESYSARPRGRLVMCREERRARSRGAATHLPPSTTGASRGPPVPARRRRR